MRICSSCTTKNRESARFCDQCGTRFQETTASLPVVASYTPPHLAERILKSRAALQGERKRVTVLFADIKNSTQLAEKIGAEHWHQILTRFFAILSSAVHRFEGTVNQYTGDGIMALFGAPIAHEDHAHRAALAAMGMQREVARYAVELENSDGLVLRMRVGLNTGEVVVGSIGDDLRMDYTAKGLTVNLAARMEHLCEPGSIYLSRYTAILIERSFQLLDLGERVVQGSTHPIRVYELQGERARHESLSLEFSRTGLPLFGRDDELQSIKKALEKASVNGCILAVSGEAGIGKSRLFHEFSRYCSERNVPVHRANCLGYSAAVPLLPVRDLMRSRLSIADQADSEDVHHCVNSVFASKNNHKNKVVPVIADFLGASEVAQESGNLHSLMLERIARYLPRAEVPQVLVVEDLHFADEKTADFLTRLCEQIAGSQTLLLLNYRSDYTVNWFAPYLDEQIALKALSMPALQQMACKLLGPARNLIVLARLIAQRAGGNPFFVEEAVQALAEAGYLRGGAGNYVQTKVIDEWPIPHSVQALIAGRLDRLPEQQKTLLQAASVMGRSFNAKLLKACIGSDDFEADVMSLIEAGFIHAQPTGNYEFRNALTQEVSYYSQLESQRAQTHAGVATALELLSPLTAPATAAAIQIAHHWEQAENWIKAGHWNLHATHWLAPRDLPAALGQVRLAITHLDRAEYSFETVRLRIAARAGLIRVAQYITVERSDVEQAYHDAWKMAEEFSDVEAGAELLVSYGAELLHRGEAERAAQLVAQGASDALAAGKDTLLRRFRFLILMTHNTAGRLQEGLKLANAAGDGWLQRPVAENNFIARGFYGELLMWQGHLPQAFEYLEASATYSERENREPIWQLAALVDWAWFSGRHEQAVERSELAIQRAQNCSSPLFEAFAHRAAGLAQLMVGQYDKAITVLEQGLSLIAPGAFGHPLEANYLAVLSEAYAGSGQMQKALDIAEQAIVSAKNAGARIWELRAWVVYLQISNGVHAAEGIARMEELMIFSGAYVFRPWWLIAKARLSNGESGSAACKQEVRAEFERIGAHAHASRLTAC